MSNIRDLTIDEIDAVSGAGKFHYITTPAGTVYAVGTDRNGRRLVVKVT